MVFLVAAPVSTMRVQLGCVIYSLVCETVQKLTRFEHGRPVSATYAFDGTLWMCRELICPAMPDTPGPFWL